MFCPWVVCDIASVGTTKIRECFHLFGFRRRLYMLSSGAIVSRILSARGDGQTLSRDLVLPSVETLC